MADFASIYQNQKQIDAPDIAGNLQKGMGVRSVMLQNQAKEQENQSAQMQAHLQKAQMFGEAMKSVTALPPDQQPQAYAQVRNELVQNGIIKPEQAPEQHDPMFLNGMVKRYEQTAPGIQAQLQRANLAHTTAETAKLESETVKRRPVGSNVNDPAQLVPQMVPKEHQSQVFKEIDAAENTKRMSGAILKAFDEATGDTSGIGALTSLVKTPRSALALHQAMQPTFKDLEGTVRQAAMDNTFKNITPSVGDSKADIATKRAALMDYLQSKRSAPTARGYGIDLDRFENTQAVNSPAPPVQSRGLGDLIPSAQAAAPPAIKPGTADGGYVYMGGDPGSPKNWKRK